MSKYFDFIGSAKELCAALCLIGCLAFAGCGGQEEIAIDFDSVSEDTDEVGASEYDAWVKNFSEEMKKSGAVQVNGSVSFAQGTTGAVPAFNFASAATTGAAPTFNFAPAAATTGDAPAFNFAPAATTGDAPAFNFAPAATTGDAAPAFDFTSLAKQQAEEKEKKEAEEKAKAEEAAKKAAEEEAAKEDAEKPAEENSLAFFFLR